MRRELGFYNIFNIISIFSSYMRRELGFIYSIYLILLAYSAISNNHGLASVSLGRAHGLDFLHNIQSLLHIPKHDVFSIQPRGGHGAEEELGSVCVGTSVGHGENPRTGVLVVEVLIGELLAVDGFTSGSVSSGEISTLAHKVSNHSVKFAAFKVKGLS